MPYVDLLSNAALQASAQSILKLDQYDDWVPDPVHYLDLTARLAQPAILSSVVRRASADPAHAQTVRLPRAGGSPLNAIVLPFGLRTQAHAAVVRIAPRLRAALPRDRVFGFQYYAAERRFSEPGEGVSQFADRFGEIMIHRSGSAHFTDVAAAWSSMRWGVLSATLSGLGADAEDLAMIGRCYGRGPGLPTGDDAWAFLVNVYLRKVDMTLVARRVDFYRVRDEYITFAAADAAVVAQVLRSAGFGSRTVVQPHGAFGMDLEEACADATEDDPVVDIGVLKAPGYEIRGRAQCDTERHAILSDEIELYVAGLTETTPAAAVARLDGMLAGRIDAVDMAPLLRLIWTARAASVLQKTPTAGADQVAYARRLGPLRAPLTRVLTASLTPDRAWAGHTAAVLLSDSGPLASPQVDALKAYSRAPSSVLGGAAARAALARSSAMPAAQLLPAGFPHASHPILRRWDGLTAYYLARRGVPQPFETWKRTVGPSETPLADRLSAARSISA